MVKKKRSIKEEEDEEEEEELRNKEKMKDRPSNDFICRYEWIMESYWKRKYSAENERKKNRKRRSKKKTRKEKISTSLQFFAPFRRTRKKKKIQRKERKRRKKKEKEEKRTMKVFHQSRRKCLSPSAQTAPFSFHSLSKPFLLFLPLLLLLLLLLPDHIRHASAVKIEPSGKTKYKKESTNLYLECILNMENEMNGEQNAWEGF